MPRRPVALAALLSLLLAACSSPPAPFQSPGSDQEPRAQAPKSQPAAATAAPAAKPASKPVASEAADSLRGSAFGPASRPALTPAPAAPTAAAPPTDSTFANARSPELPIVQNLGRMIIYTTELSILAENLDTFATQIANLVLPVGGYVAGVELRDEGGVPTAIVRLKVPPQQHEAVLRGLRGLAVEVRDQRSTTQDVTEEYSDVQTQLASLEASHAQLLELMKRAGSVEELLKVQQQAAQVKLQIDRLKGRATALERLSELATITVKAQLASVALQRDYTAVRAALRKAEATRASLETQLKSARTPPDEAGIRDRLGETLLEIEHLKARVGELEAKATAIGVTLPAPDLSAVSAQSDDTLPKQYVETRVALRRAQHDQEELTRALQFGRADVDPAKLTEAILRANQLAVQLKTIQERAAQIGTALPTLTAEQEAALAGIGRPSSLFEMPASIRSAWEASWSFLATVVLAIASALAFLWWLVPVLLVGWLVGRRRLPTLRRPGRTGAGAP